MGAVPLSLLDLVPVAAGGSVGDAVAASVEVAREAERSGYRRIWYAEHHNMPVIASSAPAVLIAHVAAHTSTIRLGAGGVMLPNHAPLVVAEQFGTLASIHPGRIELGLGRAPGTDQTTVRALRRDPAAADTFPQDVLELQAYLSDASAVPGVEAVPGRGTRVPLVVLGSSLFGARLAATLGLPYGFASHFAPDALHEALAAYRDGFTPSEQLEKPHAIVGVNVVLAGTAEQARADHEQVTATRLAALLGRGRHPLAPEEARALLDSPAGRQVRRMLTHTAVGTPDDVAAHLASFAADTGADELITVHHSPTPEGRLRSVRLTAQAWAAR